MDADSNIIMESKYKLIYFKGYVCVKGDYSVMSYEDELIILKCGNDNVCINGISISISSLTADEIYIRGNVTSISFA